MPIVISINSAGYKSNTKSWMLFKFSEFFYKNIFRRAPKFEGHGSSLFYAISIVPEHVVSSVHLYFCKTKRCEIYNWSTTRIFSWLGIECIKTKKLTVYCNGRVAIKNLRVVGSSSFIATTITKYFKEFVKAIGEKLQNLNALGRNSFWWIVQNIKVS